MCQASSRPTTAASPDRASGPQRGMAVPAPRRAAPEHGNRAPGSRIDVYPGTKTRREANNHRGEHRDGDPPQAPQQALVEAPRTSPWAPRRRDAPNTEPRTRRSANQRRRDHPGGEPPKAPRRQLVEAPLNTEKEHPGAGLALNTGNASPHRQTLSFSRARRTAATRSQPLA